MAKPLVEKYRPKTISDCVLPSRIKDIFQNMVNGGEMQSMILCGRSGVGKTTVAKALCEDMNKTYMFINASSDSGIDMVRTQIQQFASTVSLDGRGKVVILDEADYLNANSAQPALRAMIEGFSEVCQFILTCNYRDRIIEPLKSRCTTIDFDLGNSKAEKIELITEFAERVKMILKTENIEAKDDVIAAFVVRHFPDFRRILNELQKYAVQGKGKIDDGILSNNQQEDFSKLGSLMRGKKFDDVQQWVVDNLNCDHTMFYGKMYDSLRLVMDPQSLPMAILILNKHQYQAAFAVDQELNLMACMTELMADCKWK